MSRGVITAAIAASMAFATPAQAEDDYYTAQGFLNACDSQKAGDPRKGICVGIVTGFMARDGISPSTKAICRPNGVTNGDALAAVIQFIKANPKLSTSRLGNILFLALSITYPCHQHSVEQP